jgi:hypothetical protein
MPRTKKTTEASGGSSQPPVDDIASSPEAESTFSSEVATVMQQLLAIREATAEAITALKGLEKRHAKEMKEIRKRRKAVLPGDEATAAAAAAAVRETRANCIFTRPLPLNDGLAHLLNKMPGHMMSPTEITSYVKIYIDEHTLRDATKKLIKVNGALSKALQLEEGSTVSFRDLQRRLYAIFKEITDGATAAKV